MCWRFRKGWHTLRLVACRPTTGYSFLLPCFVYVLFSSSRRVSFGPTTIVMILTLQAVSPLANPDMQPDLYIKLALDLALYKGVLTTAMGLLRLGFLVDLLGTPVLSGFITAAGLTIALSSALSSA
jgi:SulP family sulfate permease